MHDQVNEDELIDIQQVRRWGHVIQLRDAMEGQFPVVQRIGAGRFDDGGGGKLRNGDVIWMPVASVGPEGDDNVRLDAPQVPGDLCHDLGRVGLVQLAIEVPQEIDAANTQDFGCRLQLCFTDLSQALKCWIFTLVTEPAALTPRGSDEEGFYSLSTIFGQYTARTQRFVIGGSQDSH